MLVDEINDADDQDTEKRRAVRSNRTSNCLLVASLVVAVAIILPFAASGGAEFLAEQNGCKVDQFGPHPCEIAGVDLGSIIDAAINFGWLGLLSFVLAPLAFVLLIAAVVARAFEHFRDSA